MSQESAPTGPLSLEEGAETVPISLGPTPRTGPESLEALAQFLGPGGPEGRPKREQGTREDSTSIPIPGTPFRLSAEGRLLVAVDLQELLTDQGIPRRLAERLAAQKDPEDVAKVLLNALYLAEPGEAPERPGLHPGGDRGRLRPAAPGGQPARIPSPGTRGAACESWRSKREKARQEEAREAENAAIALVIESLRPGEVDDLVRQAVALLPEPIVRRNPTLSNPFVRGKVYELAGGEPIS